LRSKGKRFRPVFLEKALIIKIVQLIQLSRRSHKDPSAIKNLQTFNGQKRAKQTVNFW